MKNILIICFVHNKCVIQLKLKPQILVDSCGSSKKYVQLSMDALLISTMYPITRAQTKQIAKKSINIDTTNLGNAIKNGREPSSYEITNIRDTKGLVRIKFYMRHELECNSIGNW